MDISLISAKNSPKSRMIYHENPEALHIGTLPPHRYFIPFGKTQNPFASRYDSEFMELLNGEWNFTYYDSIIDMPDDFNQEIPYLFPPTGSFTATTSPSTQTCAIP